MNTKYDYALLEREYVTGDMSLRELAHRHGIANHSIITAQAKARGWVKKRADYREGASQKAVVYMADQEGMRRAREAQVRDHAIEAIDEAINRMRADMSATQKVLDGDGKLVDRPLYLIKPNDVAMLIDRLQVLFNRPSQITEERSLGINLSAGATPELLRGIVEATRGIVVDGTDPGGAPFPRTDRTRTN